MIKLFNTEFETSMRLLLLLNNYPKVLDSEEIRIIDLLTVYVKQFNISDISLNGDCIQTLAEFTSGIELFEVSLKELALEGLISVRMTSDGFKYKINKKGSQYCSQMSTDYAKEYIIELLKVKSYIAGRTVNEVKKEITNKLLRRDY